jgi:putative sterol carrier protein
MTEFNRDELRSIGPDQFVALVKTTDKRQLADLMSSDLRKGVLDTIFEQMPGRFRPDRAGSTEAVIQWNITGGPEGGVDSYDLTISKGTCTAGPATSEEPKVSFTLGGTDFLTLIAGTANPMMMFMTGKLKAKGDLALASNIANLFDLPKG